MAELERDLFPDEQFHFGAMVGLIAATSVSINGSPMIRNRIRLVSHKISIWTFLFDAEGYRASMNTRGLENLVHLQLVGINSATPDPCKLLVLWKQFIAINQTLVPPKISCL